MKLSRALLLSILITLALTAILTYFIGPRGLALFLFLPLGFGWNRKKSNRPSTPRGNEPIEPR